MNKPSTLEHISQSPEMLLVAPAPASTLTPAEIAAMTAALNARSGGAGTLRPPVRVRAGRALGGGKVRRWRLETDRGPLFAKTGPATQRFDAEAGGLELLADAIERVGHPATLLQVAQPLAHGEFAEPTEVNCASFLVLNWISLNDNAEPAAWSAAGTALAALHGAHAAIFGWDRDNSLGTSVQHNTPEARWPAFWRERRLKPQFAMLRAKAGRGPQAAAFGALADREAALCAASDLLLMSHAPASSVLHGDFWRGNLGFESHGRPVLYDPACWFGDAETDIAMAHLFGGIAPVFFAAYEAARPPLPGHLHRRALYQLYHVLNHANLFGGSYLQQARALIDKVAGGAA